MTYNILEKSGFYEVKLSVTGKNGLHARPSMALVERVGFYDGEVRVYRADGQFLFNGEEYANAKSVMDLMTLNAPKGTELTFAFERNGHDGRGEVTELVSDIEKILADED